MLRRLWSRETLSGEDRISVNDAFAIATTLTDAVQMKMTSDNTLDQTPRRGRILRLLRRLLASVVLVGAGIACTVYFHPTARFVRHVEAMEGQVVSEYVGPHWLGQLVDKKKLTMFHRIELISLWTPAVTDEGLSGLNRHDEITQLYLNCAQIGDSGLCRLDRLPNLEHLDVRNTQIGDDSLKGLSRFPRLNSLYIGETRVTDEGLAHLREVPQLEYLDLENAAVTDAGIREIEQLINLKHLCLIRTKVTDDGLAHLRPLTRLMTLDLGSMVVTDAGLPHLKHLISLKVLRIKGTPVTAAGIADLKAALPNLEVSAGEPWVCQFCLAR